MAGTREGAIKAWDKRGRKHAEPGGYVRGRAWPPAGVAIGSRAVRSIGDFNSARGETTIGFDPNRFAERDPRIAQRYNEPPEKLLDELIPGWTVDDLRAIGFATPESKVSVTVHHRINHNTGQPETSVRIFTVGGGVRAVRRIAVIGPSYARSDSHGQSESERVMGKHVGRVYVRNVSCDISDEYKGLGAALLATQVTAALRLGAVAITCSAAGNGRDLQRNPKGAMNGFYTWARLGFDGYGTINTSAKPKRVRISEQMRTPEGRRDWLKNGEGWDATFSLLPNSYSLRTLNRYLRARKKAGLPGA